MERKTEGVSYEEKHMSKGRTMGIRMRCGLKGLHRVWEGNHQVIRLVSKVRVTSSQAVWT